MSYYVKYEAGGILVAQGRRSIIRRKGCEHRHSSLAQNEGLQSWNRDLCPSHGSHGIAKDMCFNTPLVNLNLIAHVSFFQVRSELYHYHA